MVRVFVDIDVKQSALEVNQDVHPDHRRIGVGGSFLEHVGRNKMTKLIVVCIVAMLPLPSLMV